MQIDSERVICFKIKRVWVWKRPKCLRAFVTKKLLLQGRVYDILCEYTHQEFWPGCDMKRWCLLKRWWYNISRLFSSFWPQDKSPLASGWHILSGAHACSHAHTLSRAHRPTHPDLIDSFCMAVSTSLTVSPLQTTVALFATHTDVLSLLWKSIHSPPLFA